jgi:hypothetical protein
MSNNANDLFDFVWNPISEKLLICKDDPTIDKDYLKLTNSCKIFEEITCNSNPSAGSSISLYDMIHINISIAYWVKNNSGSSESYRIFKVDRVYESVACHDYFVGILQFTQASFENLMLCCSLLENLYELEGEVIGFLKSFEIDAIQAERDMEVLLQPIQLILFQNIKQYLVNQW